MDGRLSLEQELVPVFNTNPSTLISLSLEREGGASNVTIS